MTDKRTSPTSLESLQKAAFVIYKISPEKTGSVDWLRIDDLGLANTVGPGETAPSYCCRMLNRLPLWARKISPKMLAGCSRS